MVLLRNVHLSYDAKCYDMSTIIKKKKLGISIKWLNEMAELKWMWTILNISGYTAFIYALFISFANVDLFTRLTLSIIGALFLLAKLIVYCISAARKHKLENLQIRREKNIEKAIELKQRQEEIETYERENEIIRSYNGK